MQVNFIAQPDLQLGELLNAGLARQPAPHRVVLVSAFVSLQAIRRLKGTLTVLHSQGAAIRVVTGVDMGGTCREVLQELATWPVEVFVFKNRRSGVIFHPKIYLLESADRGEIFVGSNNFTDGGFYSNYEGAVSVRFELPLEAQAFADAGQQLAKFINPQVPIGRRLDQEYLALLLTRRDIPSQADVRAQRINARIAQKSDEAAPDVFGFETTKGPPKLPIEVQEVVTAAIRNQLDDFLAANRKSRKSSTQRGVGGTVRRARRIESQGADITKLVPLAQIEPTAFYLELTATKGKTGHIPGEQRVPLEALNAAQEFWGWPSNYTESRNPRKGKGASGEERVYFNWRPVWRITTTNDPTKDVTKEVRMYFYKNSSDFRFYSSDLTNWANAGDIIRLVRSDDGTREFECTLAVAGTPEHAEWRALCRPGSGRSPRVFGFS
jgi:hypothetical protein